MSISRNRIRLVVSNQPNLKGNIMRAQLYLIFDGRCEEVIGFSGKALGAEVDVLHFKDSPEPPLNRHGSAPDPRIV